VVAPWRLARLVIVGSPPWASRGMRHTRATPVKTGATKADDAPMSTVTAAEKRIADGGVPEATLAVARRNDVAVGVSLRGRALGWALPATCAVACLLAGAGPAGAAIPYTAYVANAGTGTVVTFDTATAGGGSVIAVGKEPQAIAITPDGSTAYVVNKGSNSVTPIETATNNPGAPITVGKSPAAIAITPDGKTAYVANSVSGTLTPIEIATNTAGAPIAAGKIPIAIAITPDGKTAYVVDGETNTVTPIHTATNTAGTPIAVEGSPTAIAITPDGKTAYVTNFTANTVTPIDTATNTAGAPIAVGEGPRGITISPDGKTAYVTDYAAGAVTPIDIATGSPGAPIAVGGGSWGIALTPDGGTAYAVGFASHDITPIDTAGSAPGAPIATFEKPTGIAITPDEAPLAFFTATAAPAGSPSTFSAAASSVAYGTIADYHWSFGDGESADTAAPTTTHSYTAAGAYTVTLTETDSAGTSTGQVFTGQTVSRNGSASAKATHTLTVNAAPHVTSEPTDSSVTPPAEASFTVACSGSPAPSVQWQLSSDSGLTWSEIPGQIASTLVVSPTTLFLSANEYRAVCTNLAGSQTSSAARLSLNTAPLITSAPSSERVIAPAAASFTVACTGSPEPSVQWQLSRDRGGHFTNLQGQTSATLKVSPSTPSENSNQYRAVCTNPLGAVTSAAVTLTVGREPDGGPSPVTPVLGSLAGAKPVSGETLVKLPSSGVFARLTADETVPVGSVIDASRGVVVIVTALGRHGRTQSATFWGGVFQIVQSGRDGGLTGIVMKGAPLPCARVARAAASSSHGGHAKVRRLWAKDNHGRYVAYGSYSATTVLGTEWETEDSCAGTLTRVLRGEVRVRDSHRHRAVLVRAGHSYLARP